MLYYKNPLKERFEYYSNPPTFKGTNGATPTYVLESADNKMTLT
jgi:hypothetical protein